MEEEPYHEGRWTGLITALAAAGRRADALDAYGRARALLRDRLGIAPGVALEAAHEDVLHGTSRTTTSDPEEIIPRPAVLEQVLAAVGKHRVVQLVGPAGAGKSTLLRQLHDPRTNARTVHIDCSSSPWTALEPLRELLEALDADAIIGRTPSTGDLPGRVGAALSAAADERPLLVTLDDAPAAGPTTWRALTAAIGASTGLRLVLACRAGEALPHPFADAPGVQVPPLDLDEVRRLTELLLRRRGQVDGLAAWLAESTGGNPLFVRELVLHMRQTGKLRPDADGVVHTPLRAPAPERLQSVVGQRLENLGMRARRTCDVLATVAPLADDGLLELLGVTAADLDLLRDAQLVADGPGVAFHHAALQQVARELTPPGRRVEIALVAAEGLADRGAAPAEIARMRLEAVAVEPRAAAAACRDAAAAAAADQAFGEAVQWSDRGLSALEGVRRFREAAGQGDDALPVELAVIGADAARLGGLAGHASRLLTAAEQALDCSDPMLRRQAILALLRLGECCQPGPEQQRAVELGERALQQETDPGHAARLHASLSLTCSMVDPAATRSHIESALAHLHDHDADDELAVDVLPYTYMSLTQPADLDDRAAAASRLARAAGQLGDPVAAYEADHLAFSVALARGTRDELQAAHDRMEAARTIVADAGRRWSLHYQRATLAQLDLDLEDANALAVAAREVGETVAPARAWATWAAQLLELQRLAGTLGALTAVIVPMVDAPGALPAWRAAAALVLSHEDATRARELLPAATDELLRLHPDFATMAALQTAARAAVRLEDADVASRLLPRLRPWTHLWSWQGTTTYGPLGDTVTDLGRLLGDQDAVEAGERGARQARTRMQAPDYP